MRHCILLGMITIFLKQIQCCVKIPGIHFYLSRVSQCELIFLSKKKKNMVPELFECTILWYKARQSQRASQNREHGVFVSQNQRIYILECLSHKNREHLLWSVCLKKTENIYCGVFATYLNIWFWDLRL